MQEGDSRSDHPPQKQPAEPLPTQQHSQAESSSDSGSKASHASPETQQKRPWWHPLTQLRGGLAAKQEPPDPAVSGSASKDDSTGKDSPDAGQQQLGERTVPPQSKNDDP